MKKNMGIVDSMIRLFISAILFDLAVNKTVTGYWNILAWIFASFFLVIAVVGWCPLYALFHIHTNQRKNITHQEDHL